MIAAHRRQIDSRQLCGSRLESPGLVCAPKDPKWYPEGSVRTVWGLPVRLEPTELQMAIRNSVKVFGASQIGWGPLGP